MDSDDKLVGRVCTRREVLATFGATGAAFLAACVQGQSGPKRKGRAAAADNSNVGAGCVVTPEMTEGPYFVDEKLNRADIRSDPSDGSVKDGALLVLSLNISQISADACQPLAGAMVDIWHCDAQGIYSDVSDPGFNTRGKKFLRGYQTTDAGGEVKFTTIYPGWYQGRTVHIHFKVRAKSAAGKNVEMASQLFFDDALTDQVHSLAPYASKGKRDVRNGDDGIFQEGGSQLILPLTKTGAGYSAKFNVGMQMS